MTFKDLKKRVTLEAAIATPTQQSRLFGRLKDKPFWIWNVEDHKRVNIATNRDCCFNHIVGCPEKDGIQKPMFDYKRIIFEALQNHSHLSRERAA